MSFANKPSFIKQAFASNGIKDTIPDTTLQSGYASYNNGFPSITMIPKESGGLPPRGQDMNGILNQGGSQFDMYTQMGGTYSLDSNILNNGGYAKNCIVYQDDGMYMSLVDNNTDDFVNDPSVLGTTWQLIVEYNKDVANPGTIGQLNAFARLDVPTGWLRCDGTQYTRATYPDFWDNYLTQNKLPTCTYADYATSISDNNGNCGAFAIDTVNLTFKVPTITGLTYITQALASGDIAKYNNQTLPNITGTFKPNNGFTDTHGGIENESGAIYKSSTFSSRVFQQANDSSSNCCIVGFDASRSSSVYQNGADVLTNNIQYPVFVYVANKQVPVSEAQYNGFISSLTAKADTNLGNITNDGEDVINTLIKAKMKSPTVYGDFSLTKNLVQQMPCDGYLEYCINTYTAQGFVRLQTCDSDGTNKKDLLHNNIGVSNIRIEFWSPFLKKGQYFIVSDISSNVNGIAEHQIFSIE